MSKQGKSVIVVLGMHRSGTSAITRGLEILGIELGGNLMPATPGVNDKGFFEDTGVNEINSDLLHSIGQDWHTLAQVPAEALLDEKHAPFRLRAIELLRSRLEHADSFGMKDPRMCRLLPFWQKIFEHLRLNVSYVIAVRNPVSVAKSLERVHRLPPEKCHYLWLEHILPSVLLTQGKLRVFVDYDRLLAAPEQQIARMATVLGLKNKLDSAKLEEFTREFLDRHLRHAIFEPQDVFEDPRVPDPVRQAVTLLDDIVSDKIDPNSATVIKAFSGLAEQMRGMSQAMSYLLTLDNVIANLGQVAHDKDVHIGNIEQALAERVGEVAALSQKVHDKDVHIGNIEQALAERAGEVAALTQTVHDKDVHIGNIEQALAERKGEVAVLSQAVHDKDVHIGNIERALTERNGEVATLNQAVQDKDVRIGNIEQALAERTGEVAALGQVVHDKDVHIGNIERALGQRTGEVAALSRAVHDKDVHITNLDHAIVDKNNEISSLTQADTQKGKAIQQLHISTVQLNYRLDRARTSLVWKLAKPLRAAKDLWRRFGHKLSVDMIPLAQLERNGGEWRSTGNAPQFLLMADRAWHGLAGWYWLNVEIQSEQPLNATLHFDVGAGIDPTRAISFVLAGNGLQRIPVYIPHQCQAIRLDPCDIPATFKLAIFGMTVLKNAPELEGEFGEQSGVYESLGGRDGNAAILAPAHDISEGGANKYCWRAEGADPWFMVEDLVRKLRPGWYMTELRVRADVDRGNAKFYFDFGEGYSEANTLIVPFISGRTAKRVYHLKAVPKHIRFDPIDCVGQFSVERVHFAPIVPTFAHSRMLRRLKQHSAQYDGQALTGIWRDLRASARAENTELIGLLYKKYGRTFAAYTPQSSVSYSDWIAKIEAQEFSDLASLAAKREDFLLRPTISVVMPTYNTPEFLLRKAIESVMAQSYPNWELCIADDASPEPHVRTVLDEYVQRDARIKLTFRAENGHISAASNSALSLAAGDYVALLDHDDELAPHALHFVVEALNRNPSAQVIYSDEDKIDEEGNRSDPHFKSDWNPDLFFSQNYISHLGVYRRELLKKIGGFRVGVEGSQDQDLLLRCLAYVKPAEIVHVPKVLYHWRMLEGSTAMAAGEKSYTTDAGIKALRDYFDAQSRKDVRVEAGLLPNTYRVRYPIPQPEPLVSLLIPTRDMLVVLEPCVRSIIDTTTYQNYEIIILDNESVEPATLEYFDRIQAEDARVRVLPYHKPFNYSAINNFGVRQAGGDLVGLINNDIEVINGEWLTEMVSHALRPEIGCVGAKLYYDDKTIQHAGVILGIGGVAGHSHKSFSETANGYFSRLKIIQNLSAVTAACLVVRKSIYEEVGGLEEEGLRVAFNDIDFCLKVRDAGYRNLWTPYAELYHHESKSRGTEDTPEKVLRFNQEVEFMKAKWGAALQLDPFYSPALSLSHEDFSLEVRK